MTEWSTANPPASGEDVLALETALDVKLAPAHRDFLLLQNGARPRHGLVNDMVGITGFLSTNEIVTHMQGAYRERIPRGFLPVADAEGGNLVCLSPNGSAMFWDHEFEADEGDPPTLDNLTPLAAGFNELLAMLHEDATAERSELDPGEEVWVDPAFARAQRDLGNFTG